jgi:hypothetical protein
MERSQRTIFPAVMLGCAITVFACAAATGDAGKASDKAQKNSPPAAAASSNRSGSTVAAKVGDKAITVADLDAKRPRT